MIKNISGISLNRNQFHEQHLSPLKNQIKILKKKLPEDFFVVRNNIHSCTSVVRNIQRQPPSTSNFPRKLNKYQDTPRETLTANCYDTNKQQQLIMGVIKTARQIKRVIRKHSVQLRKQQVPRKKISQFDFQLPPLLLKKGVTSAF